MMVKVKCGKRDLEAFVHVEKENIERSWKEMKKKEKRKKILMRGW